MKHIYVCEYIHTYSLCYSNFMGWGFFKMKEKGKQKEINFV